MAPETVPVVRGERAALAGRAVLAAALVLASATLPALGHELPTFPRVRLLSVLEHPWEPTSRILVVEVRDPSGRQPVAGAQVFVSGLERERGSAVRLGDHWLAPTPQPGVYQGEVRFPGRGLWDLTVTVRGQYVGEAHLEVTIAGDLPRGVPRGGQPELAFGWRGWMLLLQNWGHLVGFGAWLGTTVLALLAPRLPTRVTVTLTWLALAVGVGTGFNKMEHGTPFPRGLSLLQWEVPRIFFAREYVFTLAAKHVLILGAILVTAAMTREAWRRHPEAPASRRFRRLLLANLVIVLAVGGAAAVMGLLHAIVLHFG